MSSGRELLLAIEFCHPFTMAAHKPLCQKRTILSLPLRGKVEEVANDLATATASPAIAWPRRAICDVDVVVTRNLIAWLNLTSCHEKTGVSFVQQPGIWVAAVVHVAIWSTPKDDLPVGIRTVLYSFTNFLPNRRVRRYLSNNVDTPDPLACVK
jgi:hypothetical protein